ncbi:Teichoic acid transport system ATP-binding protein [Clostridium neonatale]|uniref:ABC transporter ATP-binding protein n=1 Tax=Clostridium neonatale TaxID=137838 RepID=UPI001D76BD35|nr:ABC transporter ATP-binding protein [Clostridium neonatale]CAG9713307.1 Teichoic acid transport system ATP-binding protein [Clostridium neonatale]
MNNKIAISIDNVSKIYKLYDKPIDRLKESLNIFKKSYHKDYYALKNLNLNIKKGEVVGIIGTNGSGKSTLLKIVTGVVNPSKGNIQVNGTIAALLELGAGFNPEYTGIENVYLNGTMMNKSKEEVDKTIDEIIKFADIGDFINQPVKTYSSGMFVRLAFAVAINTNPEILIVDEALSVGDINFQMKSINKIKEMIKKGVTVLFVSHDIITIKSLCNKALYLNKGDMIAYGDSGEICDLYLADQNKLSGLLSKDEENDLDGNNIEIEKLNENNVILNAEFESRANEIRQGNGKARIKNIIVEDESGNEKLDFYYKEKIKIKIYFEVEEDISSIVVAFYLRNRNQLELIGTNSLYENIELKNMEKGSTHVISYEFVNYLQEGEYGISSILADNIPTTQYYDNMNNIIIIKSYDTPMQKRWALVSIPVLAEYKKI